MRNLTAIFAKFLEICKDFSSNLVNESGNVPRRGVVPKFSDLEVIALSMTAEHFSIDSENLLFHILHKYKSSIPNLISRRQYNDRRKQTRNLCNEIRQRIAKTHSLFEYKDIQNKEDNEQIPRASTYILSFFVDKYLYL